MDSNLMDDQLLSENLKFIVKTPDEVRDQVAGMSEQDRAEVSQAWLRMIERAESADPWIHGYRVVRRSDDSVVGSCGFKGPPDETGMVEIAYGIEPEFQGNGYATEAAVALVKFAWTDSRVRRVWAHTLPNESASTRVLQKAGFANRGEVIDPDDGPVWRWEISSR